jgi:hypothetical protein
LSPVIESIGSETPLEIATENRRRRRESRSLVVSRFGSGWQRALVTWVAASLIYSLPASLAYLGSWQHWSSQMNGSNTWDRNLGEWFLAWIPMALSHGWNPLITTSQYVPGGVNLMWNTSMPIVSLLAAPVTLVVGTPNAYAIIATVGTGTAGASMFLLLRRWCRWVPAACLGGLLYAFAPYFVAEGFGGRLQLLIGTLPPLIILVLDDLWGGEGEPSWKCGILLGLLTALELLVAEETLAILGVLVLIGAVFVLLGRRTMVRQIVRRTAKAMLYAVPVFVLVTAYPLYVQFAGPYRIHGPVQPLSRISVFSEDLVSAVVPGVNQMFAPGGAVAISDKFSAGPPEVTTYIGIPLLLLLALGVVIFRRNRRLLFFALMALASFVITLGPELTVANHQSRIRLPDALLSHIPFVNDLIPSRYAIGFALATAIVFALVINDLWTKMSSRADAKARAVAWIGTTSIAMVCLLPLVPNWPYAQVASQVPRFFTTSAVDALPSGSVAVTYPIPRAPYDQALLWQSDSHMRFRQPGGYAIDPSSDGSGTFFAYPDDVQNCLDQLYMTGKVPWPLCDRQALLPSLRSLEARAVIVPFNQSYAQSAISVLRRVLGPGRPVAGVMLWQCRTVAYSVCRW